MEILYYPDPVLGRRAAEVAPGHPGLRELVEGMLEAMVGARGVGLAGPQVGEPLRLFVASESGEAGEAIVCVNPRLEVFGPVVEMEEGCLSLPGIRADIRRAESARLEWTDLDGRPHREEFHDLMARIVQHEFDHLEGILFFERMSETDRLRIRPDLAGLEAQFRPR